MNAIEEKWDTSSFGGYFTGDYPDLIAPYGKILVDECLGSYQGDWLFVLESVNGYGFIPVGYGSCSGCDVLQGVGSLDELKTFQEDLGEDIKWFTTPEELKEYIFSNDVDLQWWAHEAGWTDFVKKVKEL